MHILQLRKLSIRDVKKQKNTTTYTQARMSALTQLKRKQKENLHKEVLVRLELGSKSMLAFLFM